MSTNKRSRRTAVRERPRAPRRLREDTCPECGARMRSSTASTSVSINGELVRVPGVPHLVCPRCANTLTHIDLVHSQRLAANTIYRERYGLLAATEIRTLRVRHRLTQSRFAALLGLGPNTLSRWEAGRNVQSASMDVLLRLVRDVPGTLDYLRRRGA